MVGGGVVERELGGERAAPYAVRRSRRIARLRSVLAGLGAAVLAGTVALLIAFGDAANLSELFREKIRSWLPALLGLLPVIGDVLKEEAQPYLQSSLVLAAALIGGIAGLAGLWPVAPRLHDRFFADFNDQVLRPIRRPKAFDPLHGAILVDGGLDGGALSWITPTQGSRREAWDGLRQFTALGKKKGDTPLFGWTILMGRPGSGKSRLAVEFARRELALREGERAMPRTRRKRLATWWRIQVRRRRPIDDDPWDAGWLFPGAASSHLQGYPSWGGQREVDEHWLGRLRAWRPRRPTLLLLDDPRPDDARAIVDALSAASGDESAPFAHPVRLLVVNQSAPADLKLSRRNEAWTVEGRLAPLVPPLVLRDDSAWSEGNIREALLSVPRPGRRGIGPLVLDARQVAQVRAVTRGNPLLVELALRWLGMGHSVEAMTADRLLTERVERIERALLDGGADGSVVSVIALATLAGSGGGVSKSRLLDALKLREEDLGDLSRLFPADMLDLRNFLPPIRPEIIGDAFVEYVFGSDRSDAWRERFIANAWSLNARGTLRSALRIGGRDNPLGHALAKGPPGDAGLDRLMVASAFAEATSIEIAMELSRVSPKALLPLAERLAAGLDDDAALALLESLVALGEEPPEGAILHGLSWTRCQAVLLDRLLGQELGDDRAEAFARLLPRLFAVWQKRLGRNSEWLMLALARPAVATGWALSTPGYHLLLTACFEVQKRVRQDQLACRLAVALNDHAPGEGEEEAALKGLLEHTAHLAVLLQADREAVLRLVDRAERMAERLPREPPADHHRAMAHGAAAWVTDSDAALCRFHVEQIEEIAASYPDDRDMQLERARAWRNATYATTADAVACQQRAKYVDAIAAPYPDDRDMQFERARAWRNAAYAIREDAATCQQHAKHVDAIAAPYPDDRDMQSERANAWRVVAYAAKHDAAACLQHAKHVDAIAAPYPDDRDMQLNQAQLWCVIANEATDDAVVRRQYVKRVEAITASYPEDRDMQLERARAWRVQAYAKRSDAMVSEPHARRVEAITASYPEDRDMQLERAQAWRVQAYATRSDAVVSETHARRVEAITVLYPEDRDMQLERAQAWRIQAYATRSDAMVSEPHARRVDVIAAPYPKDLGMQFERAHAWRCVVDAAASDAAACLEYAQRVEAITAPYPNDRDMQSELAWVWHRMAYAVRGNAVACRKHAERVAAIAASFPDDPEFADLSATSWNWVS